MYYFTDTATTDSRDVRLPLNLVCERAREGKRRGRQRRGEVSLAPPLFLVWQESASGNLRLCYYGDTSGGEAGAGWGGDLRSWSRTHFEGFVWHVRSETLQWLQLQPESQSRSKTRHQIIPFSVSSPQPLSVCMLHTLLTSLPLLQTPSLPYLPPSLSNSRRHWYILISSHSNTGFSI